MDTHSNTNGAARTATARERNTMTATPITITAPSDLLRIADLTAAQLNAILDLADDMKDGPTW